MERPTQLTIAQLEDLFAGHGQRHVFAHWDRLDAAGQDRLLAQTARLAPRLEGLLRSLDDALAQRARAAAPDAPRPRIEPPAAIGVPESEAGRERDEAARKRGEAILGQGRLGVFLVAGGQGTRLGFEGPKGCYPVGPVGDRTLFEIQAQKIRGLARRIGRPVPWYVMTSDATDAATRRAFEAADCFGLDPADVMIFQQDMVPAFDSERRLLLAAPDRISESPNGHGGALTALDSSGALEDMEQRGVDTIFYYQVDNPLVKIGDPVFLGHHAESGAEMSCKVVRKRDPMEPVGVVALLDGRPGIVEYTELGDAERFAEDADGRLRFWHGNVAIHLLSLDFVRRMAGNADEWLPFHLALKKIPTVDEGGAPVAPDAANGYKLERFVFDALPAAERVCVVETTAAEEFSPIKNAEGKDSPDSCRRALTRLYRSWLSAAGLAVPDDVSAIEIDHALIDGPEEAASLRDRIDEAVRLFPSPEPRTFGSPQ